MRLFYYKISKSAILLFFNLALVLISAMLVLVNMEVRAELEESKRGFYSKEAVQLINVKSGWEEIRGVLMEPEWNNGIIYKKDMDVESDTRGVFYKGDFRKLSLVSGRYFSEEELVHNEKKALIGQGFEKDIWEKNGKRYIDILGEKFEVIGVFGSAQPTRLDRMKWIPLGIAVDLTGTEGEYIVDGNSRNEIESNKELLKTVMETDGTREATVLDSEGNPFTSSFLERNSNVVEKIYFSIIFSFVLNMLLSGTYWAKHMIQRIQVEKMLGFSAGKILLSVLGEYIRVVAVALLVAGVVLVGLLSLHVIAPPDWTYIGLIAGTIIGVEFLVISMVLAVRIRSRNIVMKRA